MDKMIIDQNFKFYSVSSEAIEKMSLIRNKAKELAFLVNDFTSLSREQSLAITKLEECVFWANAGISRNPKNKKKD